ncbi:MAG TPA: pyruvate carboxylase subunit B [Alicycliphilus sp.]|nr:pyruvate carboxylase subunit B [Alicycliphilus sp.]
MVGFVDETLRDGPQSLWATRMKTAAMLGATDELDRSGFERICGTSGAAFETAVRFLKEDPWERLRLLHTFMPHTPIDILIRSRNLFGWELYPDEVVKLLFRCLKDNGAQCVKVFDGLNDVRNIAAHFRIAKSLGLKAVGSITFALSPIHTDEYFVGKARELLAAGVDSIGLGDASGLLTGPRTQSLMARLNAEVQGRVPIEFVAHHTMGLAHDSYREAMRAGASSVATAAGPLANGESVPSTLDILAIAQELGLPTNLDVDAIRRTEDYFHWVAYQEERRIEPTVRYDPLRYAAFAGHQIPGGMISNFRNQLKELGIIHRLDEVLAEASRVRAEIGYPIMVTPFSQFVGVQATFNIIQGERYATVPKELYLYVTGHYGAPPGPIDPNVMDRILKGKSVDAMDHTEAFGASRLDKFRSDNGPFHSDEELLLQLFYGKDQLTALQREKRPMQERPTVEQPLRVLVDQLARETTLKTLKFEKGNVRFNFNYR